MSKVYSFRLSGDNPREAQARDVIDAWVAKGYSLRQAIVEVFVTYKEENPGQDDLISVMEQLQGLILTLEKQQVLFVVKG